MRIGIDLRTLSEGKTTGVEIYAYNLVRALLSKDNVNEYVLFYSAWKTKPAFTSQELPKNAKLVSVKVPNRLLNASMLFLGYPKLDKLLGGLDLFFSPRFLFTALSESCPLVVTVHDLSFIHNPNLFSLKQRIWHKVVSDKRAVRRSVAVIAVSSSTKQDIVKLFQEPESKVTVVYPGVSLAGATESNLQTFLSRLGITTDYILHFATIEPRKNAVSVIAAFEEFKKNYPRPLKLVIAGGLGWLYAETLQRLRSSSEKENIIHMQNVDESSKAALYAGARCVVFPSFYEGFGFPPLEAASAGAPVIAAANSSMIEVLGDAVLYVNPFRTDEITLAIKQVLEDNELRSVLIDKGLKRAAEFTWEKAAKQTLEVFERVELKTLASTRSNRGK